MRRLNRMLWPLLMLASIAATLIVMMGMFWMLEIIPLALFVGMAIAYGLLSTSRSPQSTAPTHTGRIEKRSQGI